MTHGLEFRRYAALVGCCWLSLLLGAVAQDLSTNEVLPILRSLKINATGGEPSKSRTIVCPNDPPNTLTRLLGVICEKSSDCQFLGTDQRCCKGICRKGNEPPIYEPPHGDVLGIRRKCPSYTFPERLPVKRCSKDEDCEGLNRICCPDKKDRLLYCRTAAPIWSELPFPENIDTLKTLVGFVQCQPAPPSIIDIFARPCNRTLDCVPNLCCQEGSKKICRPPKRSVLSLAVQATTRLIKG
ncbi:uncharacterized protein LOC100678038 isoform X1 [Nasonia vitripennis]|uniref:WAP domain-containing protein n=1 Tax=Nasonia vitripennis TaxID=7425 RepID=A0A7M7QVV2_NASVI|nr:uncharacterized protein LOC100678038 isoform X1 [Nasonia vitripennis]XP_016840533.1 uncharacterized protein LOC100678038 isoform X1 [Nasonia vitripennis]XP_031785133.1 uncharacterized protein LOC100678038 isoform X1 [Nasonia vitripennis]XP_031785134.1 uncharacterized protein LOC100678038 isoform X1 [Nasonia vitripennis]XP_032455557.1 uncharacterized protein LOC100678038 isoform X1 [Nasonia vitripennis]